MTAQPGAGMLNSGCSSSSVSLGKSLSRPPASAEFFVFSIFHFSWGFVRSTFQSPAELLAGIKDNRCPPRSEPAKTQRFTSTMHLHYWIHHAIVVLAWQRPQGSASLGKEMTQIRILWCLVVTPMPRIHEQKGGRGGMKTVGPMTYKPYSRLWVRDT